MFQSPPQSSLIATRSPRETHAFEQVHRGHSFFAWWHGDVVGFVFFPHFFILMNLQAFRNKEDIFIDSKNDSLIGFVFVNSVFPRAFWIKFSAAAASFCCLLAEYIKWYMSEKYLYLRSIKVEWKCGEKMALEFDGYLIRIESYLNV